MTEVMMINARRGFESVTKGSTVICAWVYIQNSFIEKNPVLKKGYSESEYEEFLKELNVHYDNAISFQELRGVIWLTDGRCLVYQSRDGDTSFSWIEGEWREIFEGCGGENNVTKSASKT